VADDVWRDVSDHSVLHIHLGLLLLWFALHDYYR
jgi:hypothetical protein